MRAAPILTGAAVLLAGSACTATGRPAAVEDIDVTLSGCRLASGGTSPRAVVDAAVRNSGTGTLQVRVTVGFTVLAAATSLSPPPPARVRSRALAIGPGGTETVLLSAVLGPQAGGKAATSVDCVLLESSVS